MITLDSVTKKYGVTIVVDQVSFHVKKGEVFALLGPNGAGKTTIVRMLLGFSRPSSGTVMINNIPAWHSAARERTGYLEEQQRIPPHLTGVQYLERSAAFLGLSGREAGQEVYRVLELCGMSAEAKSPAAGYSKGMRQRIGLAGALLGTPQLLVLDEPTSGLDPFGIRDMRRILDDVRQKGATIVMNSHILSEVEKICDTVAFIERGKVVLKDAIDSITGQGETLEDVFVRCMGGEK